MSTEQPCCPSIASIQRAVADEYRIPIHYLIARNRSRPIVRPRQIAMWLCRHVTLASLPEIGRHFDRDHTTVIHAVDSVDKTMRSDRIVAATVWRLVGELAPGLSVELRRSMVRRVA
jgi:chromosomal replication initiator protein